MAMQADVLADLLAAPPIATDNVVCAPWPRHIVGPDQWQTAARMLSSGALTLLAHWGEETCVHAAVREAATGTIALLSIDTVGGAFPSLGAHHPPAIRLERTICDLEGLTAHGAPDTRPWLNHGSDYAFLPVDGKGLHQIPVGPVHAGIIEPGHFRFTCSGETIVRLEARLGYLHRGLLAMMRGTTPDAAAPLAARASGDTTVAYSTAFARSIEAACALPIPPRAAWLRALMLEWERISNHLGDVGAVCNDAAFSLMLTHCGILRERALRAAQTAFGHRMMMDKVVPGGVATDIAAPGIDAMARCATDIAARLPGIVALYEDTASLQDRTVRTGMVRQSHVEQFGTGGFVGRAANRAFDARKAAPYAPYDTLDFAVPTLHRGDVDARVRIRLAEIAESLSLVESILAALPDGDIRIPLHVRAGEGCALVEGFRGDIFAWVRLRKDGCIDRVHLRDPSWFQWPLLETAIEGNIVADFPLCNKSFNCSYAGVDL